MIHSQTSLKTKSRWVELSLGFLYFFCPSAKHQRAKMQDVSFVMTAVANEWATELFCRPCVSFILFPCSCCLCVMAVAPPPSQFRIAAFVSSQSSKGLVPLWIQFYGPGADCSSAMPGTQCVGGWERLSSGWAWPCQASWTSTARQKIFVRARCGAQPYQLIFYSVVFFFFFFCLFLYWISNCLHQKLHIYSQSDLCSTIHILWVKTAKTTNHTMKWKCMPFSSLLYMMDNFHIYNIYLTKWSLSILSSCFSVAHWSVEQPPTWRIRNHFFLPA